MSTGTCACTTPESSPQIQIRAGIINPLGGAHCALPRIVRAVVRDARRACMWRRRCLRTTGAAAAGPGRGSLPCLDSWECQGFFVGRSTTHVPRGRGSTCIGVARAMLRATVSVASGIQLARCELAHGGEVARRATWRDVAWRGVAGGRCSGRRRVHVRREDKPSCMSWCDSEDGR